MEWSRHGLSAARRSPRGDLCRAARRPKLSARLAQKSPPNATGLPLTRNACNVNVVTCRWDMKMTGGGGEFDGDSGRRLEPRHAGRAGTSRTRISA